MNTQNIKEKKSVWDNHTPEIKKLLQKTYPTERFSVRTENYSGGKSINITTTLLKRVYFTDGCWRVHANASPTAQDNEEYLQNKRITESNREAEQAIKRLLSEYWAVDYCSFSGEILAGANCFLFVEPLQEVTR